MHGLVRCKHERRCSRARWGDASFTDVKIKPQIGNRIREVNDVMHRKRGLRIWGIWGKAVCWVPASERQNWDSDLGEAGRLCALQAPRVGWVESWRCKSSQHRKIVCVCLSLIMSKNFYLKGNKKFRTWTNFVNVVYFGFPMSISHIRISGYVTYVHINTFSDV